MRARPIPSVDLPALDRQARRTTLCRAALAVLLVLLLVTAVLPVRRPDTHERFLPAGTSGIVVLDLSASISLDTYSRIGRTLRELVATRGRFGLVVFSDIAYEALPPGTRAAELQPLIRYFTLPEQTTPGFAPSFPRSPWSSAFSSGTKISSGLDLALGIASRGGPGRGSVLLISDLADDANDISRLTATALEYRRRGIPLRVVALNPNIDDQRLFERLLGEPSAIRQSQAPGQRERATPLETRFPWVFIGLGLLLAAALAVNELTGARLTWDVARGEATP